MTAAQYQLLRAQVRGRLLRLAQQCAEGAIDQELLHEALLGVAYLPSRVLGGGEA